MDSLFLDELRFLALDLFSERLHLLELLLLVFEVTLHRIASQRFDLRLDLGQDVIDLGVFRV
jgi:hypothetical protein